MKSIKHWKTRVCLIALLLLSFQQLVCAQLPTADLRQIKPFAAAAGKTVELSILGSNLDDASELRFSHPGITAKPVMLPADDIYPEPRRQDSRFEVSVAKDVPPGIYEVRAVSYFGLSTARPFVVAPADSREIDETGNHDSRETAQAVEVNSTVTGSVPARGIDWYRFQARGGQRVLVELIAERVDSRLDGQIVVYDSEGREITRNRDWFGRDPFLELQSEQDQEYFLAISDILYRGGSEHFYRLNISDRPHIDFVFPPAGEPGSRNVYTVYGRNLPGGSLGNAVSLNGQKLESIEVEIQLPEVATPPASFQPWKPRQGILNGHEFQLEHSNTVNIGFATAPVIRESVSPKIQTVSVPVEIAGQFNEPHEEDVYQFQATKGKTYCIEVIADRMKSKVDPYLEVFQITKTKAGEVTRKKVAENDDLPSFFSADNKDAINFDTVDAAASFTAKEAGLYEVVVLNQFGGGSPAHLYRLAIREPTPDFQLLASTERTLPTNRTGYSVTPLLRRGANWGVRIVAPRQDGFTGEIVVTAEGLPPGVTAKPLVLSGKTDRGLLVLSADSTAKRWAGEFKIVGKAQINNKQEVREARFASLIWGHIFSDAIRVRSRLTTRIPLAINEDEAAPVEIIPTEEKVWTVGLNQKLEIPIQLKDTGTRKGSLTIEPNELFGMLRRPPTVNIGEKETEGTLVIDFKPNGNFKIEPGQYQFALMGVGVTQYRHNVPASNAAAAEVKRLEALVSTIKSDIETTNATAEKSKSAEQVKQNADRLKRAETALTQATTRANSAEKKATPADSKFAAWSKLITVNVTPPSENK
ncbi:hypothetical protein [Gimesia sp.]|uniref:hypothetical protein n=1 Tax=Gimesia sp. TaxID=2024833 RepID=UPI000C417E8E|nr:hypothetical protein [Gimesia sp.]MAX35197.1 hypothetical protein [Gimesia sp.]HAH43383.1 hypothetical protein [Planctomycetaceae bacterium]|tara:strand:+ start:1745 stop:4183 length:2439 start_codon:yes stop_codon:yes gene_type:complete